MNAIYPHYVLVIAQTEYCCATLGGHHQAVTPPLGLLLLVITDTGGVEGWDGRSGGVLMGISHWTSP